MKLRELFNKFTSKVSLILGRAWVFIAALVLLSVWLLSGPLLGFSDTWQLVINTTTTIITFLMVFIIQNTQNRDNMAMNIKQDAIMKKLGITKEELIEAEDKSDKKLEKELKRVQNNAEIHKKSQRKKSTQ
jgi:low affinity Fe/Cu permease